MCVHAYMYIYMHMLSYIYICLLMDSKYKGAVEFHRGGRGWKKIYCILDVKSKPLGQVL